MSVSAPASDQAYEHGLRHRQDHQQQVNKKTAKHVVDSNGRHGDRIQARTADVTTSASGPGRTDLVRQSLLLMLPCVVMATAPRNVAAGYLRTPLTL